MYARVIDRAFAVGEQLLLQSYFGLKIIYLKGMIKAKC
jgi:hypothetical protein